MADVISAFLMLAKERGWKVTGPRVARADGD